MVEENRKNSFSTETGSLKFGTGSLVVINNQDCWSVPGLGIYDRIGKYIGETIEEAKKTLEQGEVNSAENEQINVGRDTNIE